MDSVRGEIGGFCLAWAWDPGDSGTFTITVTPRICVTRPAAGRDPEPGVVTLWAADLALIRSRPPEALPGVPTWELARMAAQFVRGELVLDAST